MFLVQSILLEKSTYKRENKYRQEETSLSLHINIYIHKHLIKHIQRQSQMYYMYVQIYQHS